MQPTHADAFQSSPVTGDTVQMIASCSKMILGSTVEALIDKGVIHPDDDIKDTLPADWEPQGTSRNPKDSTSTPVTWRHILTHHSSLRPDVHDLSRSYGPEVHPQLHVTTMNHHVHVHGPCPCPVNTM